MRRQRDRFYDILLWTVKMKIIEIQEMHYIYFCSNFDFGPWLSEKNAAAIYQSIG